MPLILKNTYINAQPQSRDASSVSESLKQVPNDVLTNRVEKKQLRPSPAMSTSTSDILEQVLIDGLTQEFQQKHRGMMDQLEQIQLEINQKMLNYEKKKVSLYTYIHADRYELIIRHYILSDVHTIACINGSAYTRSQEKGRIHFEGVARKHPGSVIFY